MTCLNKCPDCHNTFAQPFICATCGAQKLYDATLIAAQTRIASQEQQITDHVMTITELRAQLSEAQRDAERYRWLRPQSPDTWELLGRSSMVEADEFIDKERGNDT